MDGLLVICVIIGAALVVWIIPAIYGWTHKQPKRGVTFQYEGTFINGKQIQETPEQIAVKQEETQPSKRRKK